MLSGLDGGLVLHKVHADRGDFGRLLVVDVAPAGLPPALKAHDANPHAIRNRSRLKPGLNERRTPAMPMTTVTHSS
jgi:hypothetical protein